MMSVKEFDWLECYPDGVALIHPENLCFVNENSVMLSAVEKYKCDSVQS